MLSTNGKPNRKYAQYVTRISTDPRTGFAIFYTRVAFRPGLLIIGQNPSNFAGAGRSLKDQPNCEMLSGLPPTVNSYVEHQHVFGDKIKESFASNQGLLSAAVGMNVWHFQCVSDTKKAPEDLRLFCEDTTRYLVWTMQPRAILCFGKPAFNALTRGERAERVAATLQSEYAVIGERHVWYVPHPSGSYTRLAAGNDLPVVISEIKQKLGTNATRAENV